MCSFIIHRLFGVYTICGIFEKKHCPGILEMCAEGRFDQARMP